MGLFNLRTGKPVDGPEATIVSDLDAMVANPIAFRLHGKVHHLNPVTVKEFFAYSNALLSIQTLQSKSDLSDEEIVDLYAKLIQSVCTSITKDDVKNLTHAQATALLNLIIEHITGRAHVSEDEKKK
jgi:hypothetical protein